MQIRVPGWGNPKYVEYLDSAEDSTGLYFGKIADKLVKAGYVRGRNLFGAPYDFRKAASESFQMLILDILLSLPPCTLQTS